MLKSNGLITIVNLCFFSFSIPLFTSKSFAQSPKPFNQQQCIQGFVKEGLKPEEAAVWCNYTQQCLVRSQKEGLTAEAAKTVCDCSIKEFRKRYTTEKFREISKQADTNAKIGRQLREVGEKCFEDILFE
ncbi:hypothetical protein [Geminocystis sp. GBBB08]|uniref:hypothetical protein n=1 Tax=Geminocystis sp. GBBB08 TaxID=2604140 RepID=UPI0027E24A5B|nr:hypothetical protein [Geminocystis sp. GBBB08]MBL1211332.1 hypothetical protein [Geminocystis sp. GBBB08]